MIIFTSSPPTTQYITVYQQLQYFDNFSGDCSQVVASMNVSPSPESALPMESVMHSIIPNTFLLTGTFVNICLFVYLSVEKLC